MSTEEVQAPDIFYTKEYIWENMRFAVVDTESTGLNPKKDKIISIGGIGFSGGEIDLADSFEVLVPVAYNSASVTIHGITKAAASAGLEEPMAMKAFLYWLNDAIIVGHHIRHDIEMINEACRHHFDFEIKNPYVDTMDLTLRLAEIKAFPLGMEIDRFSLDALCETFNITPHDRHTATGDAFLTALIFQRLIRYAERQDWLNIDKLGKPFEAPEEKQN